VKDKQDTVDTKQSETKPETTQTPATGWQFVAEDKPAKNGKSPEDAGAMSSGTSKPVIWKEAEFIAHKKTFGWYALLGLAAVVVAAGVYFYNHDLVSVVVVIVAAIILGMVANRQPRTLEYQVDDTGLKIGGKTYSYDNFRSFSVVEEGAVSSLIFRPLKRFMPLVSVYFSPKDEKAIMEVIGKHLPVDNHRTDAIDSLIRRIHY
jgi:hypothetical protein